MDSRLDKLKKSLDSAVEGMSSEQWRWHPPGKWCAAEVLEHLCLSSTGTIKGFERIMTAGKPLAPRASMAQRVREVCRRGFGSHARRNQSARGGGAEGLGGRNRAK